MIPSGTQLTVELLRKSYECGRTKPLSFRIAQLKKLSSVLKKYEANILEALQKDLGKCSFEAYTAEVAFIHEEIKFALKYLKRWTKPKRVRTPLLLQPGASWVFTEPKGVVLIIAPWNYPIQLTLAPVVAAIAAGNCVVLKPSELAPASADILAKIIAESFSSDHCFMIEGGAEKTQELLSYRFDHIFFTGSPRVGKLVMEAAARHLTPVTLELGGKSPCIIDQGVDLEVVARRIVWGKFYNMGQTCVAPDYVLVPTSLKSALIDCMKKTIQAFYGTDPSKSPDYGRLINEKAFDRILGLMKDGKVVVGGDHDRSQLYVAPTILDHVPLSSALMEEEVFGPLLPLVEYDSLDDALKIVKERSHPLACYLFTKEKRTEERILQEISFGGGCVNNALLNTLNPRLPFGGIGQSGIGAYHGEYGFRLFSHQKALYKSPQILDIPIKYPPYRGRLKFMKWLMG